MIPKFKYINESLLNSRYIWWNEHGKFQTTLKERISKWAGLEPQITMYVYEDIIKVMEEYIENFCEDYKIENETLVYLKHAPDYFFVRIPLECPVYNFFVKNNFRDILKDINYYSYIKYGDELYLAESVLKYYIQDYKNNIGLQTNGIYELNKSSKLCINNFVPKTDININYIHQNSSKYKNVKFYHDFNVFDNLSKYQLAEESYLHCVFPTSQAISDFRNIPRLFINIVHNDAILLEDEIYMSHEFGIARSGVLNSSRINSESEEVIYLERCPSLKVIDPNLFGLGDAITPIKLENPVHNIITNALTQEFTKSIFFDDSDIIGYFIYPNILIFSYMPTKIRDHTGDFKLNTINSLDHICNLNLEAIRQAYILFTKSVKNSRNKYETLESLASIVDIKKYFKARYADYMFDKHKLEKNIEDKKVELKEAIIAKEIKTKLIDAVQKYETEYSTIIYDEIKNIKESNKDTIEHIFMLNMSLLIYTKKLEMVVPNKEIPDDVIDEHEIEDPYETRAVGPFFINISLLDANLIHIYPWKEAPTIYGYGGEGCCHPHVNATSANPCWGSTTYVGIVELLHKKQLGLLVDLILNYLKTCNPEDDAGINYYKFPLA